MKHYIAFRKHRMNVHVTIKKLKCVEGSKVFGVSFDSICVCVGLLREISKF